MGTGAGGDSGAFPAIRADVTAQEDDSLPVLAARLEALCAAARDALAEAEESGDVLRVHLARQFHEAATLAAKAETFYEAGFAAGIARYPVPVPPQPRKPGGHRRPRPNPAQLRLLGLVAAAGAALRHVLRHGAAAKLIAVPSAKAASLAAAGTAAVAVAVTGAVVITSAGHADTPVPGSAGAPAPAASIEAAFPVPSSTPIALLATHPKGKHAGKGKNPNLSGTGVLVPPYAPVTQPSSSAPPSQSSPPSSSPAGPAVLTISTSALDLSGSIQQETITLTATGSGWVSWKVDTTGTDLDFSKTSGVLAAGQSYDLVVSLDASQDGAAQQTFTVAGQQVTVALPGLPPSPGPSTSPASVPSVMPTPAAS